MDNGQWGPAGWVLELTEAWVWQRMEAVIVAKYDYAAQEAQELSIAKNEKLKLLDDSKNWWKVANAEGRVGYIPSNYVRKEGFMDKVSTPLLTIIFVTNIMPGCR